MAATNSLVIGSINAEDTNGIRRCSRKKWAMPLGNCNLGTYKFRYIRSTHSTSKLTWSAMTSATLRGNVTIRLRSTQALAAINRFGRFKAGPKGPASRLDRSLQSPTLTRHRRRPLPGDLPQPPRAGTDQDITTTPPRRAGAEPR